MQVEEFSVVRYLEFDVGEYQDRLTRLRANVAEDFDVVVVTAPDSIRYFSGYHSLLSRSHWRPVFLGMPMRDDREPFLYVPEQEHGVARATSPWSDLHVFHESVRHGHEDPVEVFCTNLVARGLHRGRIGMELGFGQRLGMTVEEFGRLRSLLPDARVEDAGPALWTTRALKSETEVDYLRRACEITCNGVRAGFEQLRAGLTEEQGHRLMFEAMVSEGAEEVWLTFGSGAKGYSAFNSYPSSQALKPQHLIWVDGGARYRGYQCDFIRSAVIAEPTRDQERWYSVALEANRVGVEAVGPGAVSSEIFDAVRRYLASEGFLDAWGLDVLGHGVGVEFHELPSITQHSSEKLQPGHVVTIEPSLSPPNHTHGHYIVEEVLAVTESGKEILTSALSPELWITPQ